MAFNVNYLLKTSWSTSSGLATNILQLRMAIYDIGPESLTDCTLSGTAEGELTTGNSQGTTTGTNIGLFEGCESLTSVDLTNLDTSNVTSMRHMFSGCWQLTSIDLSSFDTSNVTDTNHMFSGCSTLSSIKVNKLSWNTSSVTDSSDMFYSCRNLPNYDSSYVDKTKAIDKSLGGYLDVIVIPILKGTYKYYEHYSDGVKVIPKATDMFDFVTQVTYDNITNPDPDMLYFIIE